jgi:hypothetical protein
MICETSDPDLFPELKIPRSAIRSWLHRGIPDVVTSKPLSAEKTELLEHRDFKLKICAMSEYGSYVKPLVRSGDTRGGTGIQGNEAGFGGVERFPSYGILLDPELSNLGILTLGGGISLFSSSSLDLVYHYYRLAEPSFFLRDSSLEAALDGRHRDLGQAIDLVLAVEEWERYEFHVGLSAFRAGAAFGPDDGNWSFGGFVDFAINF